MGAVERSWLDEAEEEARGFGAIFDPPAPLDPAARMPLKRFVVDGWPVLEPGTDYIDGWHVDAICDHLEAVADGRIRFLIINMPPGHMKSLLVSVFWPAWMWTWRPEWRALFGSYDLTLAIRDAKRTRDLLDSEWYRDTFHPAWTLSGDQNVKSYYENTRKGFRLALGVGSKGTGFRGDCTVVDDPLNVKDQWSETKRAGANDWWDKTMSSRLNDQRKGARIVVMQRLHEDDLSGHLIKRGGYELLRLPSEFEPTHRATTSIGWTDPRAEEGECLFPALFPPAVLEQAKIDLGSGDYAGQHQQTPVPAGGGIIKRAWFRYYTSTPPVWQQQLQSWDMSFKDTKSSDFVAGGVWGKSGANCYLLDVYHERAGFTETCRAVRSMTEKWPGASAKLVEDKANGPAVIDTLRATIGGLIAVEPEGGKEARAHAVTPFIEAGNVWLPSPEAYPQHAGWVEALLHECETFTGKDGGKDDLVDMMTQALLRLCRRGGMRDAPAGPKSEAAAIAGRKF